MARPYLQAIHNDKKRARKMDPGLNSRVDEQLAAQTQWLEDIFAETQAKQLEKDGKTMEEAMAAMKEKQAKGHNFTKEFHEMEQCKKDAAMKTILEHRMWKRPLREKTSQQSPNGIKKSLPIRGKSKAKKGGHAR